MPRLAGAVGNAGELEAAAMKPHLLEEDKMQIYLRSFSAAAVLALVILLLGLPRDAYGGNWSVCNRTTDTLEIAIGYANPTGGIVSSGWWKLVHRL